MHMYSNLHDIEAVYNRICIDEFIHVFVYPPQYKIYTQITWRSESHLVQPQSDPTLGPSLF